MEPVEYLRALRRKAGVIVAAVLVGVLAAWLSTEVGGVTAAAPTKYVASTFLMSQTLPDPQFPDYNNASANFNTVAALTTIGEVPVRVAKKLGYAGDPLDLAAKVKAAPEQRNQQQTGILKISATSTDPEQAKTLAETFSFELIGFLSETDVQRNVTQAKAITGQLDQTKTAIQDLDKRIARAGTAEVEFLREERDAKVRLYGLLYEGYQQLAVRVISGKGLAIIQHASSQKAPETGFRAPRTAPSRMIFAGILGLLAGIALALVLARFDVRIRTKEAAETHFGLPVLTEIPLIPRRKRRRLTPFTAPKSRSADAFRLLGVGMMKRRLPEGGGTEPRSDQIILVTSPGPGEGKTTVAANLAVALSEVGKTVLVLSCDFHRPKIHRLFKISNELGLTDAMRASNGSAVLNGHIKDTQVEHVRVVPTGTLPKKPAEMLGSDEMRRALQEARQIADVVILDSPPILAASESAFLLPEVDSVLLVARANKTTVEEAVRASELLKRLDAPVVGVALNGATEGAVNRRYYYYYAYHKGV